MRFIFKKSFLKARYTASSVLTKYADVISVTDMGPAQGCVWPTGAVNRVVRWGKTRRCRKPISERHKRYKIPLHALHPVYDLVSVCMITTCSVESAPV